MNIFRLCGDLSHLLAIIILLIKIWHSRSCSGLSGKAQVLFSIVFLTRYLDLLTTYVSLYNSIMKVVFIILSLTTVYLIYFKFRSTYEGDQDALRIEFILVPVAILAVLVNHQAAPIEILWTFSVYLETVAILPQLYMITKMKTAETITSHYLFALGVYRALYIVNWVYRYQVEGFYDLIAIVAGCVQTLLYLDFFYLYCQTVLKGKELVLPV